MSRWLVSTSLRIRFLIVVIAAVLLVFGFSQVASMPVDIFPEFNPPLVEIQTEALGLSAEEMEALITVPMEADLLNGVAWLDEIYSESVTGVSSILLVFEPGTDPIRARQMVQERMSETFALPNVSRPPTMLQPLSTSNRLMMVGLSSDEISLIDMSVLARWNIAPKLLGVPGVANVAIWGQREWQLQVLVDPERIQDAGVTLDQIIATSGEALWVSPLSYLEASSPGTTGWIDTPNQRLTIRHELPIRSASDMDQIPIQGTAYRLGDVTTLVEDHQPLIGDAILHDKPGLILVIEKFPDANSLEVTAGVEEALRTMSAGLQGINIDTNLFRSANYIELSSANLQWVAGIGAVLLVAAIFGFFVSWRAAVVSLIAIPLSLISTLFILEIRDQSLNIMVLTGLVIALGVIIDDAIVDADQMLKQLRENQNKEKPLDALDVVQRSATKMRGSLVVGTVILLVAVLPVFFMPQLTKDFLSPLATTYILAVISSLVIAQTVTPALSALLFNNGVSETRESSLIMQVRDRYTGRLTKAINKPNPTWIIAGILLVLAVGATFLINTTLLPDLKQTNIRIQWDGAPATSRAQMARITSLASKELREIPGVVNVGSHIGRAVTGDEVVGINSAEIWLSLDSSASYEETLAAIREVIAGYPGLFRDATSYQPDRLSEVLAPGVDGLTVRVFGHEFGVLEDTAQDVARRLESIEGVQGVTVESTVLEPQIEIEVDLAAAERFQVKPGDVRRSATTLLSGLQVGNLYEEQKVFEVIVWGIPEVRRNLNDVHNLLVDTPRGGHVRLGEVADIRIVPAPLVIKRDAVSRYIDVHVDVANRSTAAVAADVEAILLDVPVPFEYHVSLLGGFAELRMAFQRVWIAAVISLIGIFLLLRAKFESTRLSLITLLSWPVALSGSVLAVLALNNGTFSLGSIFGLLTVFGFAVRSSILLVQRIQELHFSARKLTPEVVIQGASDRFKPMMATTIAAGLVMLTIVLAGDRAGLELIHPVAVVTLGGLITTAFVNLRVLPALYLRFGKAINVEEAEKRALWLRTVGLVEDMG